MQADGQITLNNVTIFTDASNYTVTNETTINMNKLLIQNDGLSMRAIAWEEFRKIDFNRTDSAVNYNLDIQNITSDNWTFNITSTLIDSETFLISSKPEGLQIDSVNVDINFTSFLTTIEVNNGRLVHIIYTPSVAPIILPNFSFPVFVNQTNPELIDFIFIRTDTNATETVLDVQYPLTYDTNCKFYFTLAQVTLEYSNLTEVPIGNGRQESTFSFNSPDNDIIDVTCTDTNTNATGRYLITQNDFELLTLLDMFRSPSAFGTSGIFGALDFITLSVMVVAFLGFNRINESVGVIMAVFIIGGAAFFGIIQFPTIIFGAIAVIVMLAIVTTRKPG